MPSEDVAVRAERLGKRYLLQGERPAYETFRDALTRAATAPLRWVRGESGKASTPFWALRDVSFTVPRGKAFGIIGPNGSGKSTLLKLLARITEPSEGRARIRGRVGSLLEVGTGFHPELTGRENIYLNGAILGMDRADVSRRFDEIVAFAGVERFLDTQVKHYSSGMYMRLAFSVAAHLETDVLIVDEVLAVGDHEFQARCLGHMEAVSRTSGRTVLFVSHNLGAVTRLCDQAIWLEKGSVRAEGPAEDVVTSYLAAVRSGELTLGREGQDALLIDRVVLSDRLGKTTNRVPCGEPITVSVHYRAARRLETPAFLFSIGGERGGAFLVASMLFDGQMPAAIEGSGVLACTFELPFLLPQSYRVRLSVKTADNSTVLLDYNDVAEFTTFGKLRELGFSGVDADRYAADSTPAMTPYRWHLPDGRTVRVAPPPFGRGVTDV
jgi:lipopolysaccharide transport system ATP-binding protein